MFLKRILPLIIILLAVIFGYYRFRNPCGDVVDSTFQNGWQGSFQVKVERMPETCGFAPALAGAEYYFSAKTENSNEWREIMNVRFDDPLDIPPDSIHVFNETSAAVFFKYKYAVTTDKGKTWKVTDIDRDLGLQDWTDVRYIDHVNFNENGQAILLVRVKSKNGRNFDAPFITQDYGMAWEVLGK